MSGARVNTFPRPPQKIACGFHDGAAIRNSGGVPEVYVWGLNSHNCHGHVVKASDKKNYKSKASDLDEDLDKRETKVAEGRGRIYEIACGTHHTMFLMKKEEDIGGTLFGAGLGTRGRLGKIRETSGAGDASELDESWETKNGPEEISLDIGSEIQVLRVVCGSDHTIAYATNGRLYAWGANKSGQCGVGIEDNDVRNPKVMVYPEEKRVMHFAAGANHTLIVIGDGELHVCGCGLNGKLGHGVLDSLSAPRRNAQIGEARLKFVACGEAHSGGIDIEGHTWMWGAGSYGRLGHTEDTDCLIPRQVEHFSDLQESDVLHKLGMDAIALGGFHSLFLDRLGKLWSCGSGAACGFASSESDQSVITIPRAVTDTKVFKCKIVQIAAGMFHNMVLLENGSLVTWGMGLNGRLGDGKMKPVVNPQLLMLQRGFSSLKKGVGADLVDDSEKSIEVEESQFDDDIKGVMVKKTREDTSEKSPWEIKALACGSLHSCALTVGGQLYVWGCNVNGQLGLGRSTDNMYVWVPRRLVIGTRVIKEICCGYEHCLAITLTQDLFAWGKGTSGQLGTSRARDEAEPVHVKDLSQVLCCAAGEEHSAVIIKPEHQGPFELYTWGSAENGMLGLGRDMISGVQSAPVKVKFGTLAEQTTQTLQPMGKQKSRSLATSTKPKATVDARTVELGPLKVSCGQIHTGVIVGPCRTPTQMISSREMNSVYTWGGAWYGRLGLRDKAQENRNEPAQVDVEGVSALDLGCGGFHSGMVSTNGELYMWGMAQMVCEPDNLYRPKKFVHIEGQMKFTKIWCAETHTFVLTSAGELYAWGSNKYGQLGIGDSQRDAALMPEEVKPIQGPMHLIGAGTGHTVALFINGEVHAWGNQNCGRLGLKEKKLERICWDSQPVKPEWGSVDAMSSGLAAGKKRPQHAAVTDVPQDDEGRNRLLKLLESRTQEVHDFSVMQNLIKQEKEYCREEKLKDKEKGIQEAEEQVRSTIVACVEMEQRLLQLEGDLDQSLQRNIREIRHVRRPDIENVWGEPKFTACLPYYEEMLWILQTQLTYFAGFAQLLLGRSNWEHIATYRAVLDRVFEEKSDPRTRSSLLMLQRQMIDLEAEPSQIKVEELFTDEKSVFFHVFSDYCLSPHNYKTIVAPLMDVGRPSVLQQMKESCEKGDIFVLDSEAYIRQESAKNIKPLDELQSDAKLAQEQFRDYMKNGFVDLITSWELPHDVRQVLFKAHWAVSTRAFHAGGSSVSGDLQKCKPLLQLFCFAVLVPILENPERFTSSETFLDDSRHALTMTSHVIAPKLRVIADFLRLMLKEEGDGFNPKTQKVFIDAEKLVRRELLKWLQRQADVDDVLETDMVLETYNAHFDRIPHRIYMPANLLMKLSNMLKFFGDQLRISEHDEMEKLYSQIPVWEESVIRRTEDEQVHSFLVNCRWITKNDDDMVAVICPMCRCPMPRRLTRPDAQVGLIVRHGTSDDKNPRHKLEQLLRDLSPVHALDLQQIKVEFDNLRSYYRGLNPPDYQMTHQLQEGLHVIEELRNVQATKQDVLKTMTENLVKRNKHYLYLVYLGKGMEKVQANQANFLKSLEWAMKELRQALHASRELKVPDKIKNVKTTNSLAFLQISARRRRIIEPTNMPDGCSFAPIVTCPVRQLLAQKVIDQIHPPYDIMEKKMKVTFEILPSGGVRLIVSIQQGASLSNVKTLDISPDALDKMRKGTKVEKVDLKNETDEKPFFTCVGYKFATFVSKLSQEAA